MIFCCSEPLPASWVTTRAPVRVICQPVAPMRAASTGRGTRSSLASSRCLLLIGPVSQSSGSCSESVWSRSQGAEVLRKRLDDRPPHRFGQVVAHAIDDDVGRALDHPCDIASVAGPYHRILR